MKKILVPCDFSKPAVNAFKFALDIASQSKGSVTLLHVIELPIMHDTVLMPVLSFEEQLLKELREKAEAQFQKLIAKYGFDEIKTSSIVEFGLPSLVIQNHIADNNIDIVIMGSHGSKGLREYFIGSNAEKVVRNAPVPVLVLKDYFKGHIKNIVFPNNLSSEGQDDLVKRVKSLQSFFKARLHLLWVNTPVNFTSDSVSREKLNAFAKKHQLKDYTTNVYNHVDPEEGIIEFSKVVKSDLIAIGTHGRKGLAHFIAGSLAESLVNHSKPLIWSYVMKEVEA